MKLPTAPYNLVTISHHIRWRRGRTLIEILIVVLIIAILLTLMVQTLGVFRRKAQDGACMSNLRSLHASFAGYMLDHAMVWPQLPGGGDNLDVTEENDPLAEFWIKALEPYGAHRNTWLCPSERQSYAEDFDDKKFDMSYVPTQFDETPNVAYQWVSQPWLIERGGFHDGQANQVMPDGSIRKGLFPSEPR